ncbi:MAG: homoserine kinase [Bacteroidales bacterium]
MIKYKSVTAFAPATVANVSCGFDIMGFAIQGCGDKATIVLAKDSGKEGCDDNQIAMSGKYAHLIPSQRDKNTAGVAVDAYLKATGNQNIKLSIALEKNLPLGSGMGSSAASSVAAVFAVNALLGNLLSVKELIQFAMEGERVACGAAHADNAAPSLLGGFVLIRSYDPLDIIQVHCPDELYCAVLHPHIELNTSDARRVLKRDIPMRDVVKQCANAAGFMTGLLIADYDLLGRSVSDLLAEPKRTMLIPGFEQAKRAALDAGAIGCGISGSGPSIFALCKGESMALLIAEVIDRSFAEAGLLSEAFISPMNAPGALILERR